jgi:hypothetical protein
MFMLAHRTLKLKKIIEHLLIFGAVFNGSAAVVAPFTRNLVEKTRFLQLVTLTTQWVNSRSS